MFSECKQSWEEMQDLGMKPTYGANPFPKTSHMTHLTFPARCICRTDQTNIFMLHFASLKPKHGI